MSKLKDLTGMKFGRLTVIERAESKFGKTYWKCLCDCGNVTVVRKDRLKNGYTKSCGCLTIDTNSTHHMTRTKPYILWSDIKKRCFNPNHKFYKYYGGRGITMYPEWIDDFQTFYDYVSKLPHFGEKGYSLDRIDNNGNYEPNNIRWADKKTQSRNRRTVHFIEYNGTKMPITEAAELSGINAYTLKGRLKRGDIGERLFRPVRHISR